MTCCYRFRAARSAVKGCDPMSLRQQPRAPGRPSRGQVRRTGPDSAKRPPEISADHRRWYPQQKRPQAFRLSAPGQLPRPDTDTLGTRENSTEFGSESRPDPRLLDPRLLDPRLLRRLLRASSPAGRRAHGPVRESASQPEPALTSSAGPMKITYIANIHHHASFAILPF